MRERKKEREREFGEMKTYHPSTYGQLWRITQLLLLLVINEDWYFTHMWKTLA